MPDRTPDWDAQDAGDRELLVGARSTSFLAGYVDLVKARCRNRCRLPRRGRRATGLPAALAGAGRRQAPRGQALQGDSQRRGSTSLCKGDQGTTFRPATRPSRICDYTTPASSHERHRLTSAVADSSTRRRLSRRCSPGDGEIARLSDGRAAGDRPKSQSATGKNRNAVDQALYRTGGKGRAWL